jgi:hypothetical protein
VGELTRDAIVRGLVKVVQIQLPYKRRKVAVLEVPVSPSTNLRGKEFAAQKLGCVDEGSVQAWLARHSLMHKFADMRGGALVCQESGAPGKHLRGKRGRVNDDDALAASRPGDTRLCRHVLEHDSKLADEA